MYSLLHHRSVSEKSNQIIQSCTDSVCAAPLFEGLLCGSAATTNKQAAWETEAQNGAAQFLYLSERMAHSQCKQVTPSVVFLFPCALIMDSYAIHKSLQSVVGAQMNETQSKDRQINIATQKW